MSIESRYDVLVIGGGILGAAVLHELATHGLRVGLVERGVVAQGCTAYSGGIVRVFHADDRLSDIAAESYAYYKNFETHTGERCSLTQTGFLYFPAPGTDKAARERVDRLATRVPMQWLSPGEIQERFPQVRTETPAVFEAGAGYMSPPDVARAFVRAAKRHGAHVHPGTDVRRLVRVSGCFAGAETSQGLLMADRIVVALGAHTPSFLDKHNIPHSLWAQRIQVDVRRTSQVRGSHPAWIDDVNDLNGRPHEDDQFLIGYPTHDRTFDDGPVPGVAGHSELIERIGRRRFAWIDMSERLGSFASFDCYSEGGIGICDYVDERQSLAVVSGFSGGAFKLAPELARRIFNKLTKN